MDKPVLHITQLTKHFGEVVANNEIDLRVQPGQVVGLLGHNGAGKTTLVNQTVGLTKPDKGTIQVNGIDAITHPEKARQTIAIQPQSQSPLDGLTPRRAIELAGRIHGLPTPQVKRLTSQLIDALDIGEWKNQLALPEGRGLSGGIRRLTAFAMAIIAPTSLVILDEPTNDVDAARRRLLWDLVRLKADQGAGILLVTHNVNEAEQVVDTLTIVDHGKVVATGTPEALRAEIGNQLRLELTLSAGQPDPTQSQVHLPFTPLKRNANSRRVLLSIYPETVDQAVSWAQHLRDRQQIDGFSVSPLTLEDTYLTVTGATSSQGAEHHGR